MIQMLIKIVSENGLNVNTTVNCTELANDSIQYLANFMPFEAAIQCS